MIFFYQLLENNYLVNCCRAQVEVLNRVCKRTAQVVQRADNSLFRGYNELVGLHFIRWIVIYPLDRVIRSLNNRGQQFQRDFNLLLRHHKDIHHVH